ncbi:MAG TPA: hypothetical protein VF188_13780 [Longimicrobiales bacterium]
MKGDGRAWRLQRGREGGVRARLLGDAMIEKARYARERLRRRSAIEYRVVPDQIRRAVTDQDLG